MRALAALPAAALFLAAPAAAQLRAVPVAPESEAAALRGVEVFLVNEGSEAAPAEAPRQLTVTAADGTRLVVERVPGPAVTVAPGGFAKARYVPVALAAAPVPDKPLAPGQPIEPPLPPRETVTLQARGSSASFADRFGPHEPIYGAFGLGDSGGKLQVSFAFQPFGGDGPLSRLRFAYTQTMFWALDRPSGPFQNTTYSPELFYEAPIDESARFAIGWRHDSNGEGPASSIDVNRIYARAARSFDLGDGWDLELAPQAWLYVGKQGVAPDLADYWGYTALTATILKEDGLKLQLTGRLNLESGRYGGELFLSYPLAVLGGDFGVYLFGQGFHGYGETLNRYRVRDTHARLGIALTR